jgi:ATPase subunit of ABC transporter with duplicated ATPase domains
MKEAEFEKLFPTIASSGDPDLVAYAASMLGDATSDADFDELCAFLEDAGLVDSVESVVAARTAWEAITAMGAGAADADIDSAGTNAAASDNNGAAGLDIARLAVADAAPGAPAPSASMMEEGRQGGAATAEIGGGDSGNIGVGNIGVGSTAEVVPAVKATAVGAGEERLFAPKVRKGAKGAKGKGGGARKGGPVGNDGAAPHDAGHNAGDADGGGGGAIFESQVSRFQADHVGTSREVRVLGIRLSFMNGPTLLENAELRLLPGHRHVIVGRNGCGKSTLLRAIADGTLPGFPAHLRTSFIEQETVRLDATATDTAVGSDQELAALLERRAAVDAGSIEAASLDAAIAAQRGDVEARARRVLSRLGFTIAMMDAPASELSGGWVMRAALARALVSPPDVLLLDEVTNHLDMEGILWVTHCLNAMEDTCVVLVTHDRAFADDVATDVIDFRDKRLTYYPGDVTAFEDARADKVAKQQRLYESQEKRRERAEGAIENALRAAKKSGDDKRLGQVASRKKKLGRIGAEKNENGFRWRAMTRRKDGHIDGDRVEIQAVKADPTVKFHLPAAEPLLYKGPVLQLDDCAYRYAGNDADTVAGVTMEITTSSRVAIVGANGGGKSTLLRMLQGITDPTAGTVHRNASIRCAMFAQHHVDQLDLAATPLQFLARPGGSALLLEGSGGGPGSGAASAAAAPPSSAFEASVAAAMGLGAAEERRLRGALAAVGIAGALATTRMSKLSGGQRSRVVFAALTLDPPHILFLDEPTNHLDAATLEALTDAVAAFEGGVVTVSHDRHFVKSVADEIYLVAKGRARRLDGEEGFDAWVEGVRRRVARSGDFS